MLFLAIERGVEQMRGARGTGLASSPIAMRHPRRLNLLRILSLGLGLLPPGCGQGALAKLLTRHRWGQSLIVRQRLVGGATVELDLRDSPQAIAYVTRRYEPDIVAVISRLLPQFGTFFDVGANIGLVTFSIAARRPDVSIHAFEPDPANAERWRRNRQLNRSERVVLEPSALGATIGTVGIFRGMESGWTYVGPTARHDMPTSSMTTLDTYVGQQGLGAIDVVKLDVEGYELFALQGSQQLLEQGRIGAIVCEINPPLLAKNGVKRQDVVSFLATYRYSPQPITRTGARRLRITETIETAGDLVFVRDGIGLRR